MPLGVWPSSLSSGKTKIINQTNPPPISPAINPKRLATGQKSVPMIPGKNWAIATKEINSASTSLLFAWKGWQRAYAEKTMIAIMIRLPQSSHRYRLTCVLGVPMAGSTMWLMVIPASANALTITTALAADVPPKKTRRINAVDSLFCAIPSTA